LAPVLICLNRPTRPAKTQNRLKKAFLDSGGLVPSGRRQAGKVGGEAGFRWICLMPRIGRFCGKSRLNTPGYVSNK
jgi:hypothetical protein